MIETDAIYGAVAVTEMYGPETRYRLVSVHDSWDDAALVAQGIGSYDWDAAVKAYRLEHNQAAATHGEVYELIPVRRSDYGLEWDSLPAEIQQECLEINDCEAQEDFESAVSEAGYEAVDWEGELYLFAR